MKRLLPILFLLLLLTLPGAGDQAAGAEVSRDKVLPAPLAMGERLNLYSYSYLGVEVRSFKQVEFLEYRKRLAEPPSPSDGVVRMVAGEPAWLRSRKGLLITRVLPDSPAERAGLEVGDVLISLGGAAMNAPVDLLTVMRNCAPGCTMHMFLIGKDLKWKNAQLVPEALKMPAHVGHIVPRTLSRELMWKMKTHQVRAIELLSRNPVPIKEACDELEAICRILYPGYTPGSLRIPLRSGKCAISATRYGWNIDVILEEDGQQIIGSLKRWEWSNPLEKFSPAHPGPDALPEAIRHRLREVDTTPPLPPSRWDEY